MKKVRKVFLWRFKKISKDTSSYEQYTYNDSLYVKWVLKTLRKEAKKLNIKIGEEGKLNALCIQASPEIINYLHNHLSPMNFLGYAPVENTKLKKNEMVIDTDNLISKN